MPQPDATWRVYLPEWMVFYTSDAHGPEGEAECWAHFARKYEGRVREDDRRVVDGIVGCLSRPDAQSYCLELRLPNLRGEFKDNDDAWELWGEIHRDSAANPQIVQRGSPEEQELLAYGQKMLPMTGENGGNG